MLEYFVTLVVVAGIYYFWLQNMYPKGFPKHPAWSIPLIGDFLIFRNGYTLGLTKLKSKYGNIFGFLLGSKRVVFLCQHDLIVEAGKMEEINYRPIRPYMARLRQNKWSSQGNDMPGLIMSEGKTWKEQRKFAMSTLKVITKQSHDFEMDITKDVSDLCSYLHGINGRPIQVGKKLNIIALRVVWALCTEERLNPDNLNVLKLLSLLENHLVEKQRPISGFLYYQPFFAELAIKLKLWDGGQKFMPSLYAFIQKSITSRKLSEVDKHTLCFVEKYLNVINHHSNENIDTSFNGEKGLINLTNVLLDLFVAGGETTSTTLSWALLFMVLHPDVQDKVQQELDDRVGKGNQPLTMDRKKTPYTEAVLHEAQRMGCVGDKSFPRRADKDCYLSTGHFIPKDTIVFFWFGTVMKNPNIFSNPEKFEPSRHLNSDGEFVPNSKVMAFGTGKRHCLGEEIALKVIYLIFTGILSKFKVEKAHPNDYVNNVPIDGLTFTPVPYKFKFIPRNN